MNTNLVFWFVHIYFISLVYASSSASNSSAVGTGPRFLPPLPRPAFKKHPRNKTITSRTEFHSYHHHHHLGPVFLYLWDFYFGISSPPVRVCFLSKPKVSPKSSAVCSSLSRLMELRCIASLL